MQSGYPGGRTDENARSNSQREEETVFCGEGKEEPYRFRMGAFCGFGLRGAGWRHMAGDLPWGVAVVRQGEGSAPEKKGDSMFFRIFFYWVHFSWFVRQKSLASLPACGTS